VPSPAPESPAEIDLLRDGAEVFPAWLDAIAEARREILLEMYWFASDVTGQTFAQALGRRAREGLDVYVLYDAVGSIGSDEDFFEEMSERGVEVREYHPLNPWRAAFRWAGIGRRDHRKILVIDGEVAFTGGMNIANEAAAKEAGGEGWRDDCVRVRGAAAHELRALFFDTWLATGGPRPRGGAPLQRRSRQQAKAAALEQAEATPPAPIQVLASPSRGTRRAIRRHYLSTIGAARERILLENAYFIPDKKLERGLERAARRGVEVRVIVPQSSDVPAVLFAGQARYEALLAAGVRICEWTEGILHAKTALIDRWATVGTFNLDRRSLRYNLEVNVASTLPSFVGAVEASLRADLDRCVEIDRERWSRRPWWRKVLERLLYWVRDLL
jgi:cardiolipin synthase